MKSTVFAGILILASGIVLIELAGGRPGLAANARENMAPASVAIDNFTFAPATLAVRAGTTVTWANRDDIPHTVVSASEPRAFKSKALDTDDKFSFTFTKPGTYPYFCSIHPKMTGKIIVQ